MPRKKVIYALVFSSFILFFSNYVYAGVTIQGKTKSKSKFKNAETKQQERHTALGKKVVTEHEGILADSSEANRDGKTFDIVAELLGFSVFPALSAGLTVGYYWNEDLVMELNYAKGSLPLYFFDVSTEVWSARLKKYWGNSFYTNTGLAVRDLTFKFSYFDLDNKSVSLRSGAGYFGVKTAVLDLAIGNKWQWDNFTLGCDWWGLMIPLAHLSTRDDLNRDVLLSRSEEDDKESAEKLSKTLNHQLLRFYLGLSF